MESTVPQTDRFERENKKLTYDNQQLIGRLRQLEATQRWAYIIHINFILYNINGISNLGRLSARCEQIQLLRLDKKIECMVEYIHAELPVHVYITVWYSCMDMHAGAIFKCNMHDEQMYINAVYNDLPKIA